MKQLSRIIRNFFRKIRAAIFKEKDFYTRNIPEIDSANKEYIEMFSHHTMTPIIRRWNLIKAIHYVNKKKLEGDIIESGIWRGGNLFLSKTIQNKYYPQIKRMFYGYDTYEGMPQPSIHDGLKINNIYNNLKKKKWFKASLEDVMSSAKFFFSETNSFNFIKGKVEVTLRDKKNLPNKIAILRLDTDWYESTKIELNILYPLLVNGGVLIIDDYGDMIGCRKAVDEFFINKDILIVSIDKSCRIIIKN